MITGPHHVTVLVRDQEHALHFYVDILGFEKIASPINASFLFAFFFMLTCWVVGYVLDKRKIYIRV